MRLAIPHGMRTRSRPWFVAAPLALAALATPDLARAESAPPPPQCAAEILPARSARTIPANLPALVVLDRSTVGLSASVEPRTTDVAAAPDPRFPKITLLSPAAPPFATGPLALPYTVVCSDGGRKDAVTAGPTFGPAVALPAQIGAAGAAGAPSANGEVSYPVTLTDSATAFVDTTSFEVLSDGRSLGVQGYGVAAQGVSAKSNVLDVGIWQQRVYLGGTLVGDVSLCKGSTGKETHALELRAHVAGAAADPAPLSFPVEVDCAPAAAQPDGGKADGGYLPDGGGDDRGASGGDGGGCSAAGSSGLGGVGLAFAIGVIGAVIARRARPRRA